MVSNVTFKPFDDSHQRVQAKAWPLEATEEPYAPHREFWVLPMLEEDQEDYVDDNPKLALRTRSTLEHANLLSSRTASGMHAPVIDIDMQCWLVQSRTEGHYHLYIEKEMPWWRFRLMLWAMKVAGVVEPGYYRASVSRRMSFVRWNKYTHYRAPTNREARINELLAIRDDLPLPDNRWDPNGNLDPDNDGREPF